MKTFNVMISERVAGLTMAMVTDLCTTYTREDKVQDYLREPEKNAILLRKGRGICKFNDLVLTKDVKRQVES